MSAYKQARHWRTPPQELQGVFFGASCHDRQARPIATLNPWMRDWVVVIGDEILYFKCKPIPQLPASAQSHKTSQAQALPADRVLNNMSGWTENWNGRGFQAPRAGAIRTARMHVSIFRNVAKLAQIQWCEPHVTSSPDGEIVFEWWHGEKKLTIYVQEDSAEYVKVWGPNVHSEMEDGDLDDFLPLLQWLTT